MEQPSVDGDEVGPRLVLIAPETAPADDMGDQLSVILDEVKPAGFLIRQRSPTDSRDDLSRLRDLAAKQQVAFLVEDDLDLAERLGADGLHASNVSVITDARLKLGQEKILGADAALSRHDAMNAGNDGADYIAFGGLDRVLDDEVIGLIAWWRGVFVLPCLGYAASPDDAMQLVETGADFIGVSSVIWDCPDGALAGARQMRAAIEKT
ncbi:MAG: thiamine phosphate synthase [Geminicoccaceae bacterium]